MKQFELSHLNSSDYVCTLLHSQGHRPVVAPNVLCAVLKLLDTDDKAAFLERAISFFRVKAVLVPSGLDSLPVPWLRDLPEILWNTRKPHWSVLPYMIREVKCENGVFCVKFTQEFPKYDDRLTAWGRLRVRINLELKPNLWTPLSADLERRIWLEHPKLRTELFRVPY